MEILYATPGGDKPTVLVSVSVADGKTRIFPTPAAPMAPSSSPASDTIAYLEPTMAQPDSSSVPVLRYSLRFVDGMGVRSTRRSSSTCQTGSWRGPRTADALP
jgi:hypothetical protein